MNFKCYQVNPQHRNGNFNKSQWSVKTDMELQIFSSGLINQWSNSSRDVIWSVPKHLPNLIEIGTERPTKGSANEPLYIAKYTGDTNGTWHGYPVSPKSQPDHPPQEIVNKWIDDNFIDKSFFSRWIRGKLK
ncbi:hypothetical protein [Acinetobacter johnsonii]|uniref:hypothetical protein n=1 Tax=Acinetobacter johnsonii TaxID=40214 RepID=UPI002448DA0F|nr:hypothetical protein [Acinetobacter johnsonii]MDH1707054.1 hypothetical protein [Acinetobacter johnsonii]